MEPTNIVHFKFEISQKPQNYHKAQTNDKENHFLPGILSWRGRSSGKILISAVLFGTI